MTSNRVLIFDTTLRDGEQSPGATMTSEEKLEVARALGRLGVDIIEAGFPAASPDDLAAVKQIAQTVGRTHHGDRKPPVICGLARAVKGDLDKCWEAVQGAERPRIHTFLATSPIHREHKLKLSKQEVLDQVRAMVGYAAGLCPDVEFSAEDAGRTELDFLCEVFQVALDAGAKTLNVPDTVGYLMPHEIGSRIAHIKERVVGDRDDVVLSVHNHDDLGLAVANSLSGVLAGARQVEVAVNGIGERAGNASLEEIVMTLHTRKPALGLETGIDTTLLHRTSKLVTRVTGLQVQANKAIVGANAFAHEAGIHQHGMLSHRDTYEIMAPETVGAPKTALVLGKHSGKHAFAARLEELGYQLEEEALKKAFRRFKEVAEKKKQMTDADLLALAQDELHRPVERFGLVALQISCGTGDLQTATVRLRTQDGEEPTCAAIGNGPIEAVFAAIEMAAGIELDLLEYHVRSITGGEDALGEASVNVRGPAGTAQEHKVFHGAGADVDVLVASAKAYLSALNRILAAREAERVAA
ncbi:MAG: 2-isopropylmalate synthase [Sandaracinus sp.]|nr:2-isopropylmalate synthase [Sandaracinus sp.]|tara:strand:+ start:1324 stop:2904 length:1581 start_codon:yes stop_codon:yes gene_type:complete